MACETSSRHDGAIVCHVVTVRLLREELQLLQEPGSYVGEVIKVCQTLLNMSSFQNGAVLTMTHHTRQM